jgi:hypothetical protein
MKRNNLIFTITAAAFTFLSAGAFAQTDTATVMRQEQMNATKREAREVARDSEDRIKDQSRENQYKLKDLENTRKENESRAREARRVNNDATDAAKQSRRAAIAERGAQKARARADKQAKKATRATERSLGN